MEVSGWSVKREDLAFWRIAQQTAGAVYRDGHPAGGTHDISREGTVRSGGTLARRMMRTDWEGT
jgi:hypothetical protein